MDWIVSAQSDIRPTGEYDEDGGQIFRDVWYMTARNERGDQFSGPIILTCPARNTIGGVLPPDVEPLVQKFFADNPNFNPTTAEGWNRMSPVYGSDAWDGEAEYELACEEADAYDEPRPDAMRFM